MDFAELKDVDLRTVWEDEAQHFTPWLAENLRRLSSAIGIPLEHEDSEVQVEQFVADIVARNPEDGSRVLIENQLEGSDHKHLGQILTYLAGVQAQTVVWVARTFGEAHRSAIRWLNDHTVAPFAFFAVRVRVVQIADSPRSLLFEVLEHPSAWDRRVRADLDRPQSKVSAFRREFWAYYADRYPDDGVATGHARSFFWVWVEAAKLHLAPYLAGDNVGVQVRGRRGEPADEALQRLRRWQRPFRDRLEVEIGDATPAGSYANSSYPCDTADRETWPDATEWLHDKILAYREVLEASPEPAAD